MPSHFQIMINKNCFVTKRLLTERTFNRIKRVLVLVLISSNTEPRCILPILSIQVVVLISLSPLVLSWIPTNFAIVPQSSPSNVVFHCILKIKGQKTKCLRISKATLLFKILQSTILIQKVKDLKSFRRRV